MIDTNGFVKRVELELHSQRTVSHATCQAWDALPGEERVGFAQAMCFLGCRPSGTAEASASVIPEADRVAAARLMLVKLGLDTDDPRWSSEVLDRLLKAVTETPNGSVADLFCALFGVLGDYAPDLSKPIAAFLKELVIKCFTRYQRSYETVNWGRLAEGLGSQPTKAQLYLALLAIPPRFVSSQLAETIAKGLEATAFHEEATSALAV